MPRDGSGHAHNAQDESAETDHHVVHGAGAIKDPHVARADKTADLPEHEDGLAIKGMSASAGAAGPALEKGEDHGKADEPAK